MQNTALLENLFLYVGHKVKVCLSDGIILEDELKSYDEEGIFLLTKEEKIAFSMITDFLYVGMVTSYDVKTGCGLIDNAYRYLKKNAVYSEETEYKVYCRLEIKESGPKKEALEICAVDVEMYPIDRQFWDTTLFKTRKCLCFLKNGEKKVQDSQIKVADIVDIQKMPEKNDYIRIQLEKGTFTGLVIKTSSDFCTLITENKERKEIKFNDIKEIRYFGEIKISWDRNCEEIKNVLKLYGNEENFELGIDCDENELQNGTIVTFTIGVDDKREPKEFEVKGICVLSQPKDEESIEEQVTVMVRRYEKTSSEEGFYVICQEDYDENQVSAKSEIFVAINDKNIQSKKLKKKDYTYKDYQAQVDIHTTKDGKKYGVFCENTDVNNDKTIVKKNFGHAIKYNFDSHMGYLFAAGSKVQAKGSGIRFFPDRGIKGWNSERFEKKLAMLPNHSVGPGLPTYTGVYFIYTQNERGFIDGIDFIETDATKQDKTNGTNKIEVVETDVFRNKLKELYGEEEFTEHKVEEYKYGLLITYGTQEYVSLQSKYEEGTKVKYPLVQVTRECIVSKEKIDTDYTIYVVAYIEDDKYDTKSYVVESYSLIKRKKVNRITCVEVEKERLLITKTTETIDKKELKNFKKMMLPYENEITFEAPKILSPETVLIKEGDEFKAISGDKCENTYGVYRFGVLTEIDPEEKFGYINHRLCFKVEGVMLEQTFNSFMSNVSRPMLVSYKCDENNRVSEVQFPSTEMLKALKFHSGFVKKSYAPLSDTSKEKRAEVTIQLTNKQSNNGLYLFSGIVDANVSTLAEKESEFTDTISKLVSTSVWVKCVNGCEEKRFSNQTPCYVVYMVCKNEELTVEMDARQEFYARREAAMAYPLRGKKEVLIEYNGLRKNFVIKPDEETGELYAEIISDLTSKNILDMDMNPYKIAAGGAALKVNTSDDVREVFYKRDEEDDIWKHIKEGEKSGTTIVLYGQKRCGKTSLYGQVNYRLGSDNTLLIKPYIVSFSNMRQKNANKLYRDILKTICKDKQLEENVKSVIPSKVQEELTSFKKTDESLKIIKKFLREVGEVPVEVQEAVAALDKKDAEYDWIEIIKAVVAKLRENNQTLMVVMDEFTDFCAEILEKYKGNWTEEEKIKNELNFIKELEEAGAILIIIGHENMNNFFERLGLVNSMIAKSNIVPLSVLNKESANDLISKPLQAKLGDIIYEENAIKYMHSLTGRNPYVLMNLCSKMFEHIAKNFSEFVVKRKNITYEDVENVVNKWLQELKHDKVFFDMILKEAGDNWFFENNPVYEILFVENRNSLAQIYLENVVKNMLRSEKDICDYSSLHNMLERHIKQLLDESDKALELDEVKMSNYIREMIKLMEKKLDERGIITIKENSVNIVMKLYVKYLKDELSKGEMYIGNKN